MKYILAVEQIDYFLIFNEEEWEQVELHCDVTTKRVGEIELDSVEANEIREHRRKFFQSQMFLQEKLKNLRKEKKN